jgi:hypothetical protein
MVGGNNTILDALDEELARFLGTERAVVFPCGYGTNASVFNHLFGEGDLILYDELAHNSIMQGANAPRRPADGRSATTTTPSSTACSATCGRSIAAWWSRSRASTAWTATTPTCRSSSR